ncbi:hypothetical protein P154DRAFT_33538 [Amniculicola lignicola CBS 123094]|uniref:Uncharacterized protein n=1 Tax=Amniculicola lignicola CBS 123094 TaxID=1392246 RepID=A0A6A5VX40_9PLEO|nr:hypothetical protein P154DRAFT_33538 [Amniculicola lignicola CBS 123094]
MWRPVDPYTKLVAQKLQEAQSQADTQTQSLYIKAEIKSQVLPVDEVEEVEILVEMDENNSDDSLTLSELLQNDWGT